MSSPPALETLTHRLILPRDANHHGTLLRGSDAGPGARGRVRCGVSLGSVGRSANLVLKRVLDLRCFEPVSIGSVVEIRGLEVFRARAHVVVGLTGTPLPNRPKPWMDALMQFVQVDESGSPEPLAGGLASAEPAELPAGWESLRDRAVKLLAIRP